MKLRFLLTAFLIAMVTAMPAHAGVILSIESVNVNAGVFDVSLQNTGPSALNLDGFSFEISVNSAVVNLTDATTSTTTAPYVFAGHSAFGPDLVSGSSGAQVLDASDQYSPLGGSAAVGSGATVGLGQITFTVTGTLTSPATVSFNQDPAFTSLAYQGGSVTIDTFGTGTISPPTTSVPEPSAAILASVLFAISGAAWLRRRASRASRAGAEMEGLTEG